MLCVVLVGCRSAVRVPAEVARRSASIRDSATTRRDRRTRQLLCTSSALIHCSSVRPLADCRLALNRRISVATSESVSGL